MDAFVFIPLAPALGALVLFLFGRRLPRKTISLAACGAVAVAFVLSVAAFFGLVAASSTGRTVLTRRLFTWISAGPFRSEAAFRFDALAAVMVLVVAGVGLLIHIYSIGYMSRERDYGRYFACLNLFTFAMLLLVLADNLILMFVGWEGVGLCSYLLIGFWFEKPSAANAGKKAFLVNRIGDAGFLLGILFLLSAAGTTNFSGIENAVTASAIAPGTATLAALLLFVGAAGKSAQIPLHVWLPDAMEGPTPVSALIHAATMVTAGVYMVARLNALYTFAPGASRVVALVGALTAVFAGTVALVQNDIKRVLAYSTISQLGYMFLGCGVGAYAAGIFHLFTHAFFKSLLFLAAGSVIHALSGEQDLRKMGGLRKYLPKTWPVFLIGALAISGVPFLSGFFSKDAILTSAFAQGRWFVGFLGLAGAILTAFYMFRLVFLAFFGKERVPDEIKAHIHESPTVMMVPLAVLAFLSIAAGYLGLPAVLGERINLFGRFLQPVVHPTAEGRLGPGAEWALILVSVLSAAVGIYRAFIFYIRKTALPGRWAGVAPGIHRLLSRGYYIDDIYDAAIVKPLVRASEAVYRGFDLGLIDAAVDGTGKAAGFFGRIAGFLQTGFLKDYALAVLFGIVLFMGALLFR
ncbi:MAG: NADH-quinone oxidoreductase subunit L [Candidatus Aminicenantales bacterium]